jgi:hypothetical protein
MPLTVSRSGVRLKLISPVPYLDVSSLQYRDSLGVEERRIRPIEAQPCRRESTVRRPDDHNSRSFAVAADH